MVLCLDCLLCCGVVDTSYEYEKCKDIRGLVNWTSSKLLMSVHAFPSCSETWLRGVFPHTLCVTQ